MYLLLLLPALLFGTVISGTGKGSTVAEAKKEALADIVSQIGGSVQSSYAQTQRMDGNFVALNSRERIIKVDNNYPIFLPQYSDYRRVGSKYEITATVDSKRSSSAYINELKKLQRDIANFQNEAKKSQNSQVKLELLDKALQSLGKFESCSSVARVLNISNIPILTVSSAIIENEKAQISFRADGFIRPKRNEFSVEIKSSQSTDRFKLGEVYEIFVKFSHPAYFYMINHSITDSGESFSMLMEWDEWADNEMDRFVNYIPRSSSGEWLSLGEYEVVEPLGNEYIEIVASPKPFRKLPQYEKSVKWDTIFYMLDGKASTNMAQLVQHRALIKKQSKLAVGKFHYSTYK